MCQRKGSTDEKPRKLNIRKRSVKFPLHLCSHGLWVERTLGQCLNSEETSPGLKNESEERYTVLPSHLFFPGFCIPWQLSRKTHSNQHACKPGFSLHSSALIVFILVIFFITLRNHYYMFVEPLPSVLTLSSRHHLYKLAEYLIRSLCLLNIIWMKK